MEHARRKYGVSEPQACRILKQWRGKQRCQPPHRTAEDALTQDIIMLPSEFGRYGYRRITVLLQARGWAVGKDRVQRIWRRERLESAAEPASMRAVVAELWFLLAAKTRASESRPELRLLLRHDPRWQDDMRVDDDRRIHAGVPGDSCGSEAREIRSNLSAGGRDAVPENPGEHSFGRWPSVCGESAEVVTGQIGDWDPVDRTGKPQGKRVLRNLQQCAAGRMLERGDLLRVEGGTNCEREVAGFVRRVAPALSARLQAACPRAP
jgi:hypothetical protein